MATSQKHAKGLHGYIRRSEWTPQLKRLEIEEKIGVNPFKYGLVGSTDAHTGFASAEEDNFWGKFSLDAIPDNKTGTELTPGTYGWDMSASGLAAVWAQENTRAAITEAFKRRETYATSGPRIMLRFFGGFDFAAEDADAANLAQVGYDKGVPMGGDLSAAPAARPFLSSFTRSKTPKTRTLTESRSLKVGWTPTVRCRRKSTMLPGRGTAALVRTASYPQWATRST